MNGRPTWSQLIFALLFLCVFLGFIVQETRLNRIGAQLSAIEEREKNFNELTGEYSDYLENIQELLDELTRAIISLDATQVTYEMKLEEIQEAQMVDVSYIKSTLKSITAQYYELAITSGLNYTHPLIDPRKESFMIGDILCWDIESPLPLMNASVRVYDPVGMLSLEVDPLDDWLLSEEKWIVPYYEQTSSQEIIELHEDFPLGNYSYTFTFEDMITINGTFQVIEGVEDFMPRMNSVESRKESYPIDFVVTFNIKWTTPLNNSYIEIKDSYGDTVWVTDPLTVWEFIDDYWVVPYIHQLSNGVPMHLERQHPQGTWTWTFFFDGEEMDVGSFDVEEELSEVIDEMG